MCTWQEQCPCALCTWAFWLTQIHKFSSPPPPPTLIPNFLPILGKKLFGRPHISFPSPPPNQTFSKKNFFPIFFFFLRALQFILQSTFLMLNYLQQNTPTVLAFGIRKKPTSVFHVETKMPLIFIYSTFNFPPIQFQPICFDTFCFVLLFSQHFRCYHKYVKCLASWRVTTSHLWYILCIFYLIWTNR